MPIRRRLTAHEKRLVAARGAWRCGMCGELLDETYEIDHVEALCFGGADSVDNCQALHAACHRKKTLHDEMRRHEAMRRAAHTSKRRPPLSCTRCGSIVSPHFAHMCDGAA